MRVLITLCLLAVTGLQGCTSTPVIRGKTLDAAQMQHWQARGRLGVAAATQSGSGAFTWLQEGDATELSVRGPAGVGALTITRQHGVLAVQSAEGAQYNADAALTELATRLGAPLPIAPLQYWLRGIAAPATEAGESQWLETNAVLQQQGWLIRYQEWATRSAVRLPTKLVITRTALNNADRSAVAAVSPAATQPDIRIVVRIQNWQVH